MRKMWKFIFTILLLFVIVALVKAYFTPDLLGEAVDNILSYDLQANRVVPEDLNATQDGKKGKVEYPISDSVLADIQEFSWKSKAPVALSELALVKVPYFGFDGEEHMGEIVVHHDLAQEVLDIFREMDDAQYPIEKVKRIDAYQGDEETSAGKTPWPSITGRWSFSRKYSSIPMAVPLTSIRSRTPMYRRDLYRRRRLRTTRIGGNR
ncbi:MAG: hypothetical protein ACLTXL_10805 [Clostridia bacterium]